jgi:hypothetical protein
MGTAMAAGLACTAKALLAEAGIPHGFKAKAEELNTSQQYLTAYQQIATDLAKIGVQMEMVSMTISDLVGKLTKSRQDDGDYGDLPRQPAGPVPAVGKRCRRRAQAHQGLSRGAAPRAVPGSRNPLG